MHVNCFVIVTRSANVSDNVRSKVVWKKATTKWDEDGSGGGGVKAVGRRCGG
jgi:hypothetical protein